MHIGAPLAYPSGVSVLTVPSSLVTWHSGLGTVVLDGSAWLSDGSNEARSNRYANALFSNLGSQFVTPSDAENTNGVALPLTSFHLVGDSPYFGAAPDMISLRSNGLVETKLYCQTDGSYQVALKGWSSPYQGTYAVVQVSLDGTPVGSAEIKSGATETFLASPFHVSPGAHTIGVAFTNDASGGGEDRNLFLQGVSITSAKP